MLLSDWLYPISTVYTTPPPRGAHPLHKTPAHMNQEDHDQLKGIAMSAKNCEERKFLGLSFNHKKEMIFDKNCKFDLI